MGQSVALPELRDLPRLILPQQRSQATVPIRVAGGTVQNLLRLAPISHVRLAAHLQTPPAHNPVSEVLDVSSSVSLRKRLRARSGIRLVSCGRPDCFRPSWPNRGETFYFECRRVRRAASDRSRDRSTTTLPGLPAVTGSSLPRNAQARRISTASIPMEAGSSG